MKGYNIKKIYKEILFKNLKYYKSFNKKICAMVKADAYGHGLCEIVDLLKKDVDYFGVSNIFEALKIREISKKSKILIVGKVFDFSKCKDNNLEFMVENVREIEFVNKIECEKLMHLKIDCGMNRYGVKEECELKSIRELCEHNKISFNGVFTHFPYLSNKKITKNNYNNFLKKIKILGNLSKNIIHFGGSNIINYDFNYDMIRVGIGLYGYENINVVPIMKIFSKVLDIKEIKKDGYLGYNYEFKSNKDTKIAILSIGYGDGLLRLMKDEFVFINGKRCKIIGNICMDVCFIEINNIELNIGDYVEMVWNVEKIAKKSRTIPYEILTNFSKTRCEIEIV